MRMNGQEKAEFCKSWKGWKAERNRLKELQKLNILIAERFLSLNECWSSGRTKVENFLIRMNGKMFNYIEKRLPNSSEFWKKYNGYDGQNVYTVSNRGVHCWTLGCIFSFYRVKIEGARARNKNWYRLLFRQKLSKFRLKIITVVYGEVAGVLVTFGLLQPKVWVLLK